MARISKTWLANRLLLIKAMSLLFVVTIALYLVPFRWIRRAASMFVPASGSEYEPQTTARIIWAVDRSARFVPRANCLPQAVVAQFLLRRASQPGELRIGVAKDKHGNMLGHAWIEHDGRVVFGGSESPFNYATFSRPRHRR